MAVMVQCTVELYLSYNITKTAKNNVEHASVSVIDMQPTGIGVYGSLISS
jgi:hypothetical protein